MSKPLSQPMSQPLIAWFQLCRISGLCTIASNAAVVLAAMFLWDGLGLNAPAIGIFSNIGALFTVAIIAMLLYCSGMVWNDLADVDRDRSLAPRRPLPGGRISLRAATIAAFFLPGIALILSATLGPAACMLTGFLVICIALYDFFGNRVSGLGPLLMGLIRGAHAVLWMTVVDPATPTRLLASLQGHGWQEPIIYYCMALVLSIIVITWLSELETRRGRRLELVLIAIAWLVLTACALTAALGSSWYLRLITTGGYIPATAWAALLLIVSTFAIVWPGRAWIKVIRSGRRRHIGPVVGASFVSLMALDGIWASAWHPLAGLAIWLLIPVFLGLSRAIRMT